MRTSKDESLHGNLSGRFFFFFKLTRKRKKCTNVGWRANDDFDYDLSGIAALCISVLTHFSVFSHTQQPPQAMSQLWRDSRRVL